MRPLGIQTDDGRCEAIANSTGSINVASSASAFELLTHLDTGQRCR